MTYYQFVKTFHAQWPKGKKVVYIFGGSEDLRLSSMKLLEKRLGKVNLKKSVVYLSDFTKTPKAFLYSIADLKVVHWIPKVLEKSLFVSFLRELGKSQGIAVVIDESGELLDAFKKVYPKGSPGVVIDCSKLTQEVDSLIRLQTWDLAGINLSPEVVRFLREMPFETLFPIFRVLEQLDVKTITVEEVKKYGLFETNMEQFYAKKMLRDGKSTMFQVRWSNLEAGRFLRSLWRELVRLLRIKTLLGEKRSAIVASELGIPYEYFEKDYRPLAERLDISVLYARMRLVWRVLQWQDYNGAIAILLTNWR